MSCHGFWIMVKRGNEGRYRFGCVKMSGEVSHDNI